jgi:hypothetical protein
MSQIKDKTQHDTEYNVPSHQEVRTLKLTEEVELNYSHSPMNFTSRQHPQMNCSIVKSSIVSYCIFSKHSFHHSNLWPYHIAHKTVESFMHTSHIYLTSLPYHPTTGTVQLLGFKNSSAGLCHKDTEQLGQHANFC